MSEANNGEQRPAKINIGVSACLLGRKVRFDGGHKCSRFVTEALAGHFEFVAFCPEVAIGMGTPRQPIRLVGDASDPQAVGSVEGLECGQLAGVLAAAVRVAWPGLVVLDVWPAVGAVATEDLVGRDEQEPRTHLAASSSESSHGLAVAAQRDLLLQRGLEGLVPQFGEYLKWACIKISTYTPCPIYLPGLRYPRHRDQDSIANQGHV